MDEGLREPMLWMNDMTESCGHLVVRECQVSSSTLYVEGWSQIFLGDCGASDVPSGSSRPPRTGPERLPWPLAAQNQTVERIALAFPVGVTTTLGEVLQHHVAVE